ncbi:MAG: hypothetical protein IKR57_03685 [Bacilli bacterium]|nr:hypothetical protein [Bacilli bacterium]
MKKIFTIMIFCLCINRLSAIENITIDNNLLVPSFDKKIYVYNYFTNNDQVYINVVKKGDEIVNGEGFVKLDKSKTKVIVSNNDQEYIINIFKNYNKNDREESYIKNINIEGYNIDFDKDIHEYSIYIGDEEFLNINCELSNMDDYYSIEGNGNFNKSDNVIRIKTNNDEYVVHAYKSIKVSKIEYNEPIKEMSDTKKEIVKIIIITISCILIVLFYYILFINKTIYYI